MNFIQKYKKYKNKYLELKYSIKGGDGPTNKESETNIREIRDSISSIFSQWYNIYTGVLDKNRSKYTNESLKFVNSDKGLFSAPNIRHIIKNKSLESFNTFFKSQHGGDITYLLNAGDILQTKKFLGNPYPDTGIPLTENVLILGAGPNGIHMASMLKATMPDLNVNIIESRVSDDNFRLLSRGGFLNVESIAIYTGEDEVYKLGNEFRDIVQLVAPELLHIIQYRTSYGTGGLNLYGFHSQAFINTLEYYFAKLGQFLGVNIFHDNRYDINKYINEKTLCIFDATGGRFRRLNEYWAKWTLPKEFVLKEAYNEKSSQYAYLAELRERIARGEEINLYEGFLPVELSINKEKDIPYVSIGDTTIRSAYTNGSSLNFNFYLNITYILLLTKIRESLSKEFIIAKPTNITKTIEAYTAFKIGIKDLEPEINRLHSMHKEQEIKRDQELKKEQDELFAKGDPGEIARRKASDKAWAEYYK